MHEPHSQHYIFRAAVFTLLLLCEELIYTFQIAKLYARTALFAPHILRYFPAISFYYATTSNLKSFANYQPFYPGIDADVYKNATHVLR